MKSIRMIEEKDLAQQLQPVVLGGDLLSYTFVRSFHELYGINSIVLSTDEIKNISTSKFVDYRCVNNIDDKSVFLTTLIELGKDLQAQNKLALLVATGDYYTRYISSKKEDLSKYFVLSCIDFNLLDEITQKERFYAYCEELDIPYPKSWILDCAHKDTSFDVHALAYPIIAKPSNSAAYHYAKFAGKKKVFEIDTPEQLETIYNNMCLSTYDKELIVQDYIPGSDDALYSITTFSDEEGNCLLASAGRVILQDHAPSALGNPVVIIEAWPEQAVKDAQKFLKKVGYHGFANFDVKYDERDGSFKFFEINTRLGRNSYYVTLAGQNFVKFMVDEYILGKKHSYTEAREPFCYACVPETVVRRTISDEALRMDVLKRYRSGLAQFPLFYQPDSIMQKFWSQVTYFNQIRKFKKYVWDTGGKQADGD